MAKMAKEEERESRIFGVVCLVTAFTFAIAFLLIKRTPIESWMWFLTPITGVSAFIVGYVTWKHLVSGRKEDRNIRSGFAGLIVGIVTHFLQFVLWVSLFYVLSFFTDNPWILDKNFSPISIMRAIGVMSVSSIIFSGIYTIPIAIGIAILFAELYQPNKSP
jgi:hypothetical protein